jgi:hypothetical protein
LKAIAIGELDVNEGDCDGRIGREQCFMFMLNGFIELQPRVSSCLFLDVRRCGCYCACCVCVCACAMYLRGYLLMYLHFAIAAILQLA